MHVHRALVISTLAAVSVPGCAESPMAMEHETMQNIEPGSAAGMICSYGHFCYLWGQSSWWWLRVKCWGAHGVQATDDLNIVDGPSHVGPSNAALQARAEANGTATSIISYDHWQTSGELSRIPPSSSPVTITADVNQTENTVAYYYFIADPYQQGRSGSRVMAHHKGTVVNPVFNDGLPYAPAYWTITSRTARNLRVSWGDGSSQNFYVPAGGTLNLSHYFAGNPYDTIDQTWTFDPGPNQQTFVSRVTLGEPYDPS